jgi:hypothetical protein
VLLLRDLYYVDLVVLCRRYCYICIAQYEQAQQSRTKHTHETPVKPWARSTSCEATRSHAKNAVLDAAMPTGFRFSLNIASSW